MQLAWYDRTGSKTRCLHVLPKRNPANPLFPLRGREYVERFFQEIRGLGHVGIVVIKGNKTRTIALRGY